MNYVLRKAKSTDAGRIEELFLEMLKAIYHTDDAEGYQPGYLDKFFSDREDQICVAESPNGVVGFLSMEVLRDEGFLYLDDFSVAEGCRNQGVGTGLIRAAEEYAAELGIGKVVLHVEKANQGACRLYLRLGYQADADEGSRVRMGKSVG